MREMTKTALFAAVALVLLATAVLATRTGTGSAEAFDDQGEPFFPEFKLPEQARALEVVEYDPSTGIAEPFKVALVEGRWVIPSHHNYPADAKDRLARTAAGIIDLTKDTIRSDQPEDHKAMGVLDPRAENLASPEGLGKRITLRDESNEVLADLIVGKPIPGSEGQRFVRIPKKNRVYGVNLQGVELSTRFADWIETDLLQLRPESIRSIVVRGDRYDPARRSMVPGESVRLARKEEGTGWELSGGLPAGKELDSAAISDLTATLDNLEIVGVRTKPPALAAMLKGEAQSVDSRAEQVEVVASLMNRGFHVVNNAFVPEEGEVYVTAEDGVIYILQFGRVTFARGEALTAGEGAEPASDSEGTPERPAGAVESRYLFVDARFSPDLIPKPPQPRGPGELPDDVFARTSSEREARDRAERERIDQARKDYEAKLAAGSERAQELASRFAGWYYVVPGDAYRKLLVGRDALTRDPSQAPPAAPRGPAGLPPNFPGFPGGPPPR